MRQSEMPATRGGPGQQGETYKSRAHNNFHAGSSPPHPKGNDQEKGQEKDNSQELEYARKTL